MGISTRYPMSAGLFTNMLVLVTALAAPVCTEVAIPNVREYSNPDYQFSVVLPPDLRGCKVSSPCPNHGLWIPLQTVSTCVGSRSRSRYVDVDAEYNTVDDVHTVEQLASVVCRWRDARHIVWLKGEKLGTREAAGCRRDFPDGHIEVTLLVLRKTDRSPLQWIEIAADLVTTPAHYRADLRAYHRVLHGIWVHADGPHR
jgi:hypothetical protein